MNSNQNSNKSSLLRSRFFWVLIAFLAIAAFFLITEHTAHFFGVLPFALLLLCPLLHLFMHGGHREHNDQNTTGMTQEENSRTTSIDKQQGKRS